MAATFRGEQRIALQTLPQDHRIFNDEGLIIDRWGTPLFFHLTLNSIGQTNVHGQRFSRHLFAKIPLTGESDVAALEDKFRSFAAKVEVVGRTEVFPNQIGTWYSPMLASGLVILALGKRPDRQQATSYI
ncbi:MAG: hypothetical protein O7C75_03020 [Verrucomicrobia bacterium]|nr:hypothetical protein [Verrucomicrobiota bacterium]